MAGQFFDVLSGGSGADPGARASRDLLIRGRETVFGIRNEIARESGLPEIPFENRGKDPSVVGAFGRNLASFIPGIGGARPPQVLSGTGEVSDTMLPRDLVDFFIDAGATEEQAFERLRNLPPGIIVANQFKSPGAHAASIQRDILATPGADRQALIRELRLQEPLPGEPLVGRPGDVFLGPQAREVIRRIPFAPRDPKFVDMHDRELGRDLKFNAETAAQLIRDNPERYAPSTQKSEVTTRTIEPTTKRKQEEAFLSLDQLEAQIDQVLTNFDPDMLTYLGRTKQELLTIADKIQPLGPGVTRDEFVRRAITFQNAWTVINQGIKFITGAQMSQREAVRLARQFPTPSGGKDIPPDSPTLFAAKARNLLFWTQLLKARNAFVLREGRIPGVDDPESENFRNYDDPVFGQSLTEMINLMANEYNAAWDREIKTLQIQKGLDDLTPEMVDGARARAAAAMVEKFGVDPTLILDEVSRPTSLVREGLELDQLNLGQ